ncbi:MAG: hypothetical protein ACI8PZ_005057 [Myxococcota bacterium]
MRPADRRLDDVLRPALRELELKLRPELRELDPNDDRLEDDR